MTHIFRRVATNVKTMIAIYKYDICISNNSSVEYRSILSHVLADQNVYKVDIYRLSVVGQIATVRTPT